MADQNNVRVSLDFSEFCDLHEHLPLKSLFLIKKIEHQLVSDVELDVIQKYITEERGENTSVPSIQFIVNRCVVPSWEDASIFRENDTVKVCRAAKVLSKKRKESDFEENKCVLTKRPRHGEQEEAPSGDIVSDTTASYSVHKKKKSHKNKKHKKKKHRNEAKESNSDLSCDNLEEEQNRIAPSVDCGNATNYSVKDTYVDKNETLANVSPEPDQSQNENTGDFNDCSNSIGVTNIDAENNSSDSDGKEKGAKGKTSGRRVRRKRRSRRAKKVDSSFVEAQTDYANGVAAYEFTSTDKFQNEEHTLQVDRTQWSSANTFVVNQSNQTHITFDSDSDGNTKGDYPSAISNGTDQNHLKEKSNISFSENNGIGESINGSSINCPIENNQLDNSTIPTTNGNVTNENKTTTSGSNNDHHDIVRPKLQGNIQALYQEPSATMSAASEPVSMHEMISSKAQRHLNGKAEFKLIANAQVFDRRKHKKKASFPLTAAEELSKSDLYTNKSFIFHEGADHEKSETENSEDNQHIKCASVMKDWKFGSSNTLKTSTPTPPPKDYSKFSALFGAPRAGDVIAYKVLEMSEDYTPGISEYKEAKVQGFDPASQNLTVELVTCKANHTKGRFHCELEDENEILTVAREQIGQLVELHLSSLIDAKLIS